MILVILQKFERFCVQCVDESGGRLSFDYSV